MQTRRDFGTQPVAALLTKHRLSQHDLVAASTEQITHKMVYRAVRGRRLTLHVMLKIRGRTQSRGRAFPRTIGPVHPRPLTRHRTARS